MLLAKLFSEIAAFHNEIYNINYDARGGALYYLLRAMFVLHY